MHHSCNQGLISLSLSLFSSWCLCAKIGLFPFSVSLCHLLLFLHLLFSHSEGKEKGDRKSTLRHTSAWVYNIGEARVLFDIAFYSTLRIASMYVCSTSLLWRLHERRSMNILFPLSFSPPRFVTIPFAALPIFSLFLSIDVKDRMYAWISESLKDNSSGT